MQTFKLSTQNLTMPQDNPHVMYNITPRPRGGWLLTEKKIKGQPRLSATARGENSKIIPHELHAPQHVPPETLKAIGYHSLDDNKPVFATAIAGRQVRELLEAQTFSPQMMKDLGLWEKLVELQSIIVKPEMAPHLASLETTQSRKRVGTVYNITWSVEPNSKEGSIRPGTVAKKRDPQVMRMVELTTEISFALVKAADGAWTEEHERQWIKEASLTCGGGENKSITSIQVNLTAIKREDELIGSLACGADENSKIEKGKQPGAASKPAQQWSAVNNQDEEIVDAEGAKETESIEGGKEIMEETLKQKSHVHKDSHDERRNFSTILFLNHVPDDHFVGRFNITNLRLTCICIPYSALVFTANNPHGGSGFAPYNADLPLDCPLRFTPMPDIGFPVLPDDTPYTRCLTIAYSRQDCMRARTRQLNASIFGETALGGFITCKAQSNWMIRHAIRDGIDIGIPNPSVEDYLEKFSWIENGKKCFENPKLVEDALHLRGTDNEEWEIMLKATAYNSAHIKNDGPSRYESPKQKNARLEREALGDAAHCIALTIDGTRCKGWLGKDVGDSRMCANHYRRSMAGQDIPTVDGNKNDNDDAGDADDDDGNNDDSEIWRKDGIPDSCESIHEYLHGQPKIRPHSSMWRLDPEEALKRMEERRERERKRDECREVVEEEDDVNVLQGLRLNPAKNRKREHPDDRERDAADEEKEGHDVHVSSRRKLIR
ncbi:hypothetical protein VTL71DRAFT_3518 [Oculimacula yallundae]|uniref:Uncharacterized protein n=1 Tax=Oculimacula yallundae TaxID=86028 RepID=A0ABR4C7E6_9HELO